MAFDISKFAAGAAANRPVTIETVTEEILELKGDFAENSFRIGERLNEAKELLGHGEWLPWLEGKVNFSERTAQKFMALAREYEGSPHLVRELGSEKAFALLALTEEERQRIVAEGAFVDGKTKAAADLTTRELKQIVAERKAEPVAEKTQAGCRSVEDYLRERAQKDGEYREILREMRDQLVQHLGFAQTREDGICVLKQVFSTRGGMAGPNALYTGRGVGLELHRIRGEHIKRTWTEVWDHLAVLTLQEAARPKPKPEGQLMISGWMPGGTNPGHSCTCAVLVDLRGEGDLKKAFYRWTGKRWEFDAIDEEVAILPVKWMELPEVET